MFVLLFELITVIWIFFIIIISIIHWFNFSLLNNNIINFSILKYYRDMKNELSARKTRKENYLSSLNGIRCLSHLYVISWHFYFMLLNNDNNSWLFSYHIFNYINSVVIPRMIFTSMFTINGICSAKWIFAQFNATKSSTLIVIAKFYYTRLSMIVPTYYMFKLFNLVYIDHLFVNQIRDQKVIDSCHRTLGVSLLFLSNFYQSGASVRSIYYKFYQFY